MEKKGKKCLRQKKYILTWKKSGIKRLVKNSEDVKRDVITVCKIGKGKSFETGEVS